MRKQYSRYNDNKNEIQTQVMQMFIRDRACTDQMQEPYRKKLIMEYENVRSLCRETDMITMYISGSGSTMIALTQEEGPIKGWCLVCVDGFPLGFAKGTGMTLKNKYYPGWRWQ